jgi:hypothetical protein
MFDDLLSVVPVKTGIQVLRSNLTARFDLGSGFRSRVGVRDKFTAG